MPTRKMAPSAGPPRTLRHCFKTYPLRDGGLLSVFASHKKWLEGKMKRVSLAIVLVTSLTCTGTAFAQGYPTPKEGDWIANAQSVRAVYKSVPSGLPHVS